MLLPENKYFHFLYFFNMADIVGTTVASQRWPAGGGSTVASRRWADVGRQRKCTTGYPSAHWRWTAGGNLPFIATGGPTASCYLRYWNVTILFPCTKATQSSDWPRDSKHLTANTTTSLSTVQTYAFVWPCSAACARCRRILVSASEWLHGRSVVTSHRLLESTVSNLVLRRSFPPISFLDICVLMNENTFCSSHF